MNRHIRAAFTALLTELKLAPHDWASVVPFITSTLKEAPSLRLANRIKGSFCTPLEVMTGIQPRRNTLVSGIPSSSMLQLDRILAEKLVSIDVLQKTLADMHKDAAEQITKEREKQIDVHIKRTNIVQQNFQVGDIVLVRRAQGRGHKLNLKWIEPWRIVKVYIDTVYDVEKLDGGSVEKVHCAHLRLYRHSKENEEVSIDLLDLTTRSKAQYEIVDRIVDIGEKADGIILQIQ